jgi:hypothetical protein
LSCDFRKFHPGTRSKTNYLREWEGKKMSRQTMKVRQVRGGDASHSRSPATDATGLNSWTVMVYILLLSAWHYSQQGFVLKSRETRKMRYSAGSGTRCSLLKVLNQNLD